MKKEIANTCEMCHYFSQHYGLIEDRLFPYITDTALFLN